MKKRKLKRTHGGSRVIALGFAVLILAGTLLLMLPISSSDGESKDFFTCLFTSTSASCVTGLVLCDTATSWSGFGHVVILSTIQLGGIGFMTVALMLSIIVRRSITPKERLIAAQSFNLPFLGGVVRLVKKVIAGTFIIELSGAALLSLRFVPRFGAKGLWYAVFTSVSAFCNAGFDLMGAEYGEFSSLTAFSDDYIVGTVIIVLILIGGIGFLVWDEVLKFFTRRKKLSAYSKLVITASAILVIGGTAVFALLEWNNEGTIGNMSVSHKLLASLFQSVTTRTAGFNTVDLCAMRPLTKLMFLLLMFVGGCSGSTAGGIKVGTFAITLCSIVSVLRGKRDVTVFRRRVAPEYVLRAYAITALQFAVTVLGGVLIVTCGCSIMEAMFEAFSASATVGLTLSLTQSMNMLGKTAAVLMMYFGRVGILTVSWAVMAKLSDADPDCYFADARMLIG